MCNLPEPMVMLIQKVKRYYLDGSTFIVDGSIIVVLLKQVSLSRQKERKKQVSLT
jgi:hypothetical protein